MQGPYFEYALRVIKNIKKCISIFVEVIHYLFFVFLKEKNYINKKNYTYRNLQKGAISSYGNNLGFFYFKYLS